MQKIYTKSGNETKKIARDLAKDFLIGGIIALSGELGAGKTTFAQGFAEGLGIKDKIISPTFLIIRQYKIPNQKNFFYHIDLYRLENVNLKESGLEEIFSDQNNVVLVEWADKIARDLPASSKRIGLKKLREELHEIELANF